MKNIGTWFRLPKKFGIVPYIFLMYLIFPIVSLQGKSDSVKMLIYILVAVFVVVYRQIYWAKTDRGFNVLLLILMLLTSVFTLLGDIGNLYLGLYCSFFVGWIRDKKAFFVFLGLLLILGSLPILFTTRTLEMADIMAIIPFFIILGMMPFAVRSVNRQIELREQLAAANEQIGELMKKEERMRIARDLHDTLGHTLSLITLKSQLVERLASKDPERAQHEAREIQETSRAALSQVRELVSEMRAIKLSEELIEAREMLRTAEIAMHVEGDEGLEGVPDLTQNILSLCLKEAVTNIVKHSRAQSCTVTVRRSGSEVEMKIEDDGIGPSGRKNEGREEKAGGSGLENVGGGNGLKGMRERLALIEGTLDLASRPGRGTVLSVKIPLVVRAGQGGKMA
ncbi:sensor histidine kinase [Saccharibacillus alkalitolerans]|uniref:histidine kinase n=1 Tax=Saccharibacillus alkalitolerans TaxID=2705290 RepID=A0ABX0F415_9BACL|nr:sensor histidine kinase [Saccharibacillus alkalitolerans]NGZ75392.1 sensor histidine kinase [Saccharibacillus alkalitolerans]